MSNLNIKLSIDKIRRNPYNINMKLEIRNKKDMKNQRQELPKTKEAFLAMLKDLVAQINGGEVKRQMYGMGKTTEYYSINELDGLKRKFGRLSRIYRDRYYKFI